LNAFSKMAISIALSDFSTQAQCNEDSCRYSKFQSLSIYIYINEFYKKFAD